MKKERLTPNYIFESSWEVCNKVGGIYTVLSTRARTMQKMMEDKVVFIGPDFWKGKENPLFHEDKRLWRGWAKTASGEGLNVRVGRWNVPGTPLVILVDFQPFFARKNEIYAEAWNDFQVDSLHAYGDYDEASMFSYAAARVVESFYTHQLKSMERVVYQAHEWMTCLGVLYIQKHVPEIATIFTTHATSIGRSIAGNNKPLYDYLWAYNGTQMAQELNMESKHSVEHQAAKYVDCFTTVSDVTATECLELLDRECDAVLPNGFEPDFVPSGKDFERKRQEARDRMFRVANALTGVEFADDTLIVATSGRYEFKNKGIDAFLESMRRTLYREDLKRPVLALVQVPAWVASPRADLRERLASGMTFSTPLDNPIITHDLHYQENDMVCRQLHAWEMRNAGDDRVKVIFAPCYLDGADGIFDMPYYDLLIGDDLTVYPSYYEPWGYTPLESIAFHVPCVTTSLSGFGKWAVKMKGGDSRIVDGVEVIARTDYNYDELCNRIADTVVAFSALVPSEVTAVRKKAAKLSDKAQWAQFITHYEKAYNVALHRAKERCMELSL
ncbi:MAG: glycogen/starch synthase [Bacteroidaceae bacterium]|nr:glycogen/starch synthase [Bacteroidaceae bacterium]